MCVWLRPAPPAQSLASGPSARKGAEGTWKHLEGRCSHLSAEPGRLADPQSAEKALCGLHAAPPSSPRPIWGPGPSHPPASPELLADPQGALPSLCIFCGEEATQADRADCDPMKWDFSSLQGLRGADTGGFHRSNVIPPSRTSVSSRLGEHTLAPFIRSNDTLFLARLPPANAPWG